MWRLLITSVVVLGIRFSNAVPSERVDNVMHGSSMTADGWRPMISSEIKPYRLTPAPVSYVESRHQHQDAAKIQQQHQQQPNGHFKKSSTHGEQVHSFPEKTKEIGNNKQYKTIAAAGSSNTYSVLKANGEQQHQDKFSSFKSNGGETGSFASIQLPGGLSSYKTHTYKIPLSALAPHDTIIMNLANGATVQHVTKGTLSPIKIQELSSSLTGHSIQLKPHHHHHPHYAVSGTKGAATQKPTAATARHPVIGKLQAHMALVANSGKKYKHTQHAANSNRDEIFVPAPSSLLNSFSYYTPGNSKTKHYLSHLEFPGAGHHHQQQQQYSLSSGLTADDLVQQLVRDSKPQVKTQFVYPTKHAVQNTQTVTPTAAQQQQNELLPYHSSHNDEFTRNLVPPPFRPIQDNDLNRPKPTETVLLTPPTAYDHQRYKHKNKENYDHQPIYKQENYDHQLSHKQKNDKLIVQVPPPFEQKFEIETEKPRVVEMEITKEKLNTFHNNYFSGTVAHKGHTYEVTEEKFDETTSKPLLLPMKNRKRKHPENAGFPYNFDGEATFLPTPYQPDVAIYPTSQSDVSTIYSTINYDRPYNDYILPTRLYDETTTHYKPYKFSEELTTQLIPPYENVDRFKYSHHNELTTVSDYESPSLATVYPDDYYTVGSKYVTGDPNSGTAYSNIKYDTGDTGSSRYEAENSKHNVRTQYVNANSNLKNAGLHYETTGTNYETAGSKYKIDSMDEEADDTTTERSAKTTTTPEPTTTTSKSRNQHRRRRPTRPQYSSSTDQPERTHRVRSRGRSTAKPHLTTPQAETETTTSVQATVEPTVPIKNKIKYSEYTEERVSNKYSDRDEEKSQTDDSENKYDRRNDYKRKKRPGNFAQMNLRSRPVEETENVNEKKYTPMKESFSESDVDGIEFLNEDDDDKNYLKQSATGTDLVYTTAGANEQFEINESPVTTKRNRYETESISKYDYANNNDGGYEKIKSVKTTTTEDMPELTTERYEITKIPENEIDGGSPIKEPPLDEVTINENETEISAKEEIKAVVAETTTTEKSTPTTKASRVRAKPLRYDATRPRFSVKDYRQRLNQYTSTTEAPKTSTEASSRLRFPNRTRLQNNHNDNDEKSRPKFSPKESRFKSTTETSLESTSTEKSYTYRNSPSRLRPVNGKYYTRYRSSTTELPTSEGIPPPKVVIKPNTNFSGLKRPPPVSLRTRIFNKKQKEHQNMTSTTEMSPEITQVTEPNKPETVQTTAGSPVDGWNANSDDDAIMSIHDLFESNKKKQDDDVNDISQAQRVADLTQSVSKDYSTPGLFKTVSPNSRRVPSYFTIATDDPILPIEAFFPQLTNKDGKPI